MSIVVLEKIAAKVEFHIMGGRILEHESKMIYNDGKNEGWNQVIAERLYSDTDYSFDGYRVKHVLSPAMVILDDIYIVPVFRNVKTGPHKEVECPQGLHDEVNYSQEYTGTAPSAKRPVCLPDDSNMEGKKEYQSGYLSGLGPGFRTFPGFNISSIQLVDESLLSGSFDKKLSDTPRNLVVTRFFAS